MSDALIKLTGLRERERRGLPGRAYWVGRLSARRKSWDFQNSREQSDGIPNRIAGLKADAQPCPPVDCSQLVAMRTRNFGR